MTIQTYYINVYDDRTGGLDYLDLDYHLTQEGAIRQIAWYIARGVDLSYKHTIVVFGDNATMVNFHHSAHQLIKSDDELSLMVEERDTAVQEQNYWDGKND
jgi:hypothetical protein